MITINGVEDGWRVGPVAALLGSFGTCSHYTYEKAKNVYITLNIRNREVC